MNKLFHPLPLFLGLRYTRAKRQNHFVSFISLASMIGIAIGVLVLISVLSIMNGFEGAMRDRILGMLAHVTVSENDARIESGKWQSMLKDMEANPEVKAVSTFIEQPIMLNYGDEARGVLLQGVIPEQESKVASIFEHMVEGSADSLSVDSNHMIIGTKLAEELGVKVGEKVMLISPSADALEGGELPALQQFTISGLFRVDQLNYDSSFAYVHRLDAAKAFEMGDSITGLRLKLTDVERAAPFSDEIGQQLVLNNDNIWISNWTRQNVNFFKALQQQKTVMFVILLLIVSVAAFNLVSTLVMVVTDKEADIAILRTLGLSPKGVMQAFMVQGMLIGVIGTAIGVVLGLLLATNLDVIVPWLERLFSVNFISEDVYFISELESRVNMGDVMIIALSSLVLSLLATLYPAWQASKVQPAEALRYE